MDVADKVAGGDEPDVSFISICFISFDLLHFPSPSDPFPSPCIPFRRLWQGEQDDLGAKKGGGVDDLISQMPIEVCTRLAMPSLAFAPRHKLDYRSVATMLAALGIVWPTGARFL